MQIAAFRFYLQWRGAPQLFFVAVNLPVHALARSFRRVQELAKTPCASKIVECHPFRGLLDK